MLLLPDQEPVDTGLQGAGPLRHIAAEAVQAVSLSLEQRFAVLHEAEGLQRRRREHQRAVVALQTQQAVLLVHQQIAAEEAEAHALCLLELTAQRLVVVIIGDILLELLQRHAVQRAAGQVHLVGTRLAQGHIRHLGGQQARRRAAADGAELLVIAE